MQSLIQCVLALPLLLMVLAGHAAGAQDLEQALKFYHSGDHFNAVKALEPLARAGDGQARTVLAEAYDTGRGVTQDHQRALSLYRAAASQGVAEASFRLARMLSEGRPGIPTDLPQAIVHLDEAMAQDHPASFTMRGILHYEGRGGEADPEAALDLFRQAHLLGDPGGTDALAGMVLRGDGGGTRDEAAALALWREAAERGHGPSIANLGRLYDMGGPVPQDPVAAFALYQLAAQQGARTAGRILSGLHGDPDSVRFDPLRALAWCIWAEGMPQDGLEDPCAPRRASLSDPQQAAAHRLSRRLVP